MSSDRTPLADFLRARRESIQPEQVGLPREPGRRVPGLRREEVAALAGISPEYYLRLEKGRDHQPSDQVLGSIARAFRLDTDARTYLFRLVRPWPPLRRPPASRPVDRGLLELLEQWTTTPAYLFDRNHDVLAANALARVIAPGLLEPGENLVMAAFERDSPSRTDSLTWEPEARGLVAALRYHGDPGDPRLQEIVGTLSARSRSFRRIWERHEARPQSTGVTVHPVEPFGVLELHWQSFQLPGDAGQFLTTFFAQPGTPTAAALAELAQGIARGDDGSVSATRTAASSGIDADTRMA
ncbi:MAG: helix-turn-helix domain-containing protein [Herbiconiux sp.]|uniref:helix-turn-helix domain-containing protein n=1 Tax=Herbiconiux sp. TaxID=1871186 RepID=UPI00121F8107|nr:helix-turn-helix domain-containing protein [Herbiconiux sp.]TAJ49384.1 MAG: helix-turn-helix domain-containing protein [Herbiconiux sp.]